MTLLRRTITQAFLGTAMIAVALGLPGPVAAAAGERETVTVTIRCADGTLGYRPARPGRPRVLRGRDWGRGWSYDWYCVTLRDRLGNERSYAWVDFDQWGATFVDLNIVAPSPATVLLSDRGPAGGREATTRR
jgi:hypothetical protein